MTIKIRLLAIGAVIAGVWAASVQVPGLAARSPLSPDTLFISPDSTWRSEGEVFQIGVRVSSGITDLMGYNVAVTFDSSVIRILDVVEGPLPRTASDTTFFWWFNPGSQSDSVHVNGAVLGATVDGPGELFTLVFKALYHGVVKKTVVRISYSELRDGVNHSIGHVRRGGFVAVEPTVRVEEATWGAVKELYR